MIKKIMGGMLVMTTLFLVCCNNIGASDDLVIEQEQLDIWASEGFLITKDGELLKYIGNEEEVIIPDGVREVSDLSFSIYYDVYKENNMPYVSDNYYKQIKSIIIPEGVTSIGMGAFESCVNLESITLPDGLQTIAYRAFADCTSLTHLELPDSIVSIGEFAFHYCINLEEISIPETANMYGDYIFEGTKLMQSPEFIQYLEELSENTIMEPTPEILSETDYDRTEEFYIVDHILYQYNGSDEYVVIPDGVVEIGESAFAGNSTMRSVVIPSSVTRIRQRAFSGCVCLERVDSSIGLVWIGREAFAGCIMLEEIVLPSSVKWIGNEAFLACTLLKSVVTESDLIIVAEDAFYLTEYEQVY
ncbi:MAG: leucine-rich repeat domain-containing protein [Eubacteriales bacterium]